MSNAKSLNYFSVTNVDLREVAGTESHVFSNDEISIVLNGRPFDSPFLRCVKRRTEVAKLLDTRDK